MLLVRTRVAGPGAASAVLVIGSASLEGVENDVSREGSRLVKKGRHELVKNATMNSSASAVHSCLAGRAAGISSQHQTLINGTLLTGWARTSQDQPRPTAMREAAGLALIRELP